jgi:cation/acetate symporter
MSTMPVRRRVNPRLGQYFAIFASCYAALVLLALIAAELSTSVTAEIRWAILFGPIALYVLIGLATRTGEASEYFAAGRRVPAVYLGATLACSVYGGTGLVAITGVMFLIGFDALCLLVAGLTGFVLMAILLAPFFRKLGAYTIPSYLATRFGSRALAAFAATFLTGAPGTLAVLVCAATLVVTLLPGGMRATTWVGAAQTIVALLALLVPVTIAAIWFTNLPLPHLTQGPMMRGLHRMEAVSGLPIVLAPGLAFDMPGLDPVALVKRYAAPFGAIGPHGFVTLMLTVAMGVAVAPWLLPRVATAPGVYHARKTLGWATLVFGVLMLTMAAVAIFTRSQLISGVAAGTLPDWLQALVDRGYARIAVVPAGVEPARSIVPTIEVSRDVVLLAMPSATGLKATFVAVAAGGAFAACLVGASVALSALAATLAEDLWNGARKEPPSDGARLTAARVALILAVGGAAAGATVLPADPLVLLLWALALTGSTLFPVMVLSIWWKRINAFGAVAGVLTGFAVAALAIVAGATGVVAIDPALSGMFGIPASLAAAVVVSLGTPAPDRHVRELVRDIRVPGGEILYDREMRLLRLKKRQRSET